MPILLCAAALFAGPAAAAERLSSWLTVERLEQVFPGADGVGREEGAPPAAPVYESETLVGYALSTRAIVESTGYSGKPLDVVLGLGVDGRIKGALLRAHQEPILVIGVAEADLLRFVARFRGVGITETVRVDRRPRGEEVGIDAISGATVSSVVISDAILRAARIVARATGILPAEGQAAGPSVDLDRYEPLDWNGLVTLGAFARLRLSNADVSAASAGAPGSDDAVPQRPDALFVEMYVGLLTPAMIGRNLLGDLAYNRLMAEREAGEHYLFAAANGRYSFKGTEWVRSGAFDRIELAQGVRTVRFRKKQHSRPEKLRVAGMPSFRETAIFRIPADAGFDPVQPWRLDLLISLADASGEAAHHQTFPIRYRMSEALVIRDGGPAETIAADERSALLTGPDGAAPLWLQMWQSRAGRIAVLGLALTVLTVILFLEDVITRRPRLYRWLRYSFLTFTLVWLGWYAGAQLSVVNVLTFSQSLLGEFRWELFLLEPLIFILWSYVAVAMLFWGRGVFCGWLCPFGALQELTNHLAKVFRVPQVTIPFPLHERLWPIKYVAFLGIFAVSLASMTWAVKGAEVEPFKTAISLTFARSWPFVLYAGLLLGAGLFVERFFCRYMCPLGGVLAIPARLRMFEWLKRRPECGRPCQSCAVDCTVQAIHPDGRINPNECIHCLNCQVLYFDDHRCPPLIERRKRRERRLALMSESMRPEKPDEPGSPAARP